VLQSALSRCRGCTLKAPSSKPIPLGEIEPVSGATLPASYLKEVREAITKAHGRSLRTVNGRVVAVEGSAPPKKVALIEWDSVDDAVAFYNSDAWKKLAPERDKAQKTIRRYTVETEP
jgi:uncharacterized protein (DUF1330 family)